MSGIRKLSLAFGLMLTVCSLPVWAGPREEAPTHFVAISKMPSSEAQQRLDRLFYRWGTYELDLPALERQARDTGRVTLHAGGRVFDLELELNNLRAPGFKSVRQTRRGTVEEKPTPVATFKGHVVGDPESIVRLLIQPDLFQGYIRTADEWIFIDPLRKYAKSAAPSEIVLFDDDNVRPEAAAMCGSGGLAHRARNLMPQESSREVASVTEKALIPAPTLRRANIAIEADYDYYLLYFGNTSSHIEGIINGVDGIYRAELALTLQIVYEKVWTIPDPYTSTNDGELVDQFAQEWNINRPTVATNRNLAFLFTGNDTGITQGRAMDLGVICDNSHSYAYSRNHPLDIKLTAHEIGHLFSAGHDTDAACSGPVPPAGGSSCAGSGPIMCNCIQSSGPNSFSNTSKAAITSYVNNASCPLQSLPMTFYTILTNQTPQTSGAGCCYEAGHQFSSSQNGYITGLRFWKAYGETGTHIGKLWTNSGQRLAEVVFTNETAYGWQEQYLPYRVNITAGTLYWVTYNENAWQAKTGCGISPPITNGPLTAWGSAYSNGTAHVFPTNGSCSNFFADVYFTY